MKRKNIFTIGTMVAAIVVSVYFLIEKRTSNQSPNNSASATPVSVSPIEWKVYENTAYHYSIKYPQTWFVGQVQEEERGAVENSVEVEITPNLSGEKGYVRIVARNPFQITATDQASVKYRQSISVDLKSFAEAARQKEIADKGHVLPSKRVGELQELVFANQKAFSYVVTGSYDKYGGDRAQYMFLENKGVKFMVYYSLGTSLSLEVAKTFKFTN